MKNRRKLSPQGAREALTACGAWDDFHTLRSETVEALLHFADTFGYRKPRNANGSRGRYFHAYLKRLAAKRD